MNKGIIKRNVIVNEDGQLVVQGYESMVQELSSRKGMNGYLTIQFYDYRNKGKMIGYIKNMVIPAIVNGYYEIGEIVSKDAAISRMWNMSDVTNGYDHYDYSKLEHWELILHISDLKRIAAEKLSIYIE